MTRKKPDKALEPSKEPANDGPNVLPVALGGESKERAFARVTVDPKNKAAAAIIALNKGLFGETHLGETIRVLGQQIERVKGGDMTPADEMLVAQAATLDALFGQLARRSAANMEAGFLQASIGYMQLALKAQTQARCTWETLSKIKNPPSPNFIRQANIANGPQQVNNGPRTEESANQPNELKGEAHVVES
jgi:hypothetical protein